MLCVILIMISFLGEEDQVKATDANYNKKILFHLASIIWLWWNGFGF